MIDSWNSAVLNEKNRKGDIYANSLLDTVNNGDGKNLNSYPYNQTTLTTNGVTFTDNGDGTIKATGKSTATVRSGFNCHSRIVDSTNSLILPNGRYVLVGTPAGGSDTSYYLEIGRTSGGANALYGREYGDGLVFTVNGDDNNTDKAQIQLLCYCQKDYQIADAGIIFKPMIVRLPNNDLSWAPYIPTSYDQANLLDQLKCKQTTAGNYSLKATVDSDGVVTYSWEAIT